MDRKMATPFPVSGYPGPAYFCDREQETKELIDAISASRNVTLFSIRRMGKTALIHHLFHTLADKKNLITIYVDIMPTANLNGFANQLATALAQAYPEESSFGKKVAQWIKGLRPIISFDPYNGLPQFSFEVGHPDKQQATIKALLQFLDHSGKKSVIAIDEFQQITKYPEKQTEAWLRSEIQTLKNTNFIFCGSQKHLLFEMFNSAKRPFYASTQMLQIGAIQQPVYADFIKLHFRKADISIASEEINFILEWCRMHTFYVQSLCNRLYQSGAKKISRDIIQNVIDKVFKEHEAVYFTYRELLTDAQWQLLRAIGKEGMVFAPTAMGFIQRYQLGTPATVKRSLDALLLKEMIFRENNSEGSYLQVYDLFFSRWLENKS